MHRSPVSPARVVGTLEDHTVGSRQSDRYKEWRAALHHFCEPVPLVGHYSEPIQPGFVAGFSGAGASRGA